MDDLLLVGSQPPQIWALQLHDRIQEATTKFEYGWNTLNLSTSENTHDKLITVTKKFPAYSREKIKQTVKAYDAFSNIRTGDFILGVRDTKTIIKTGKAEKITDESLQVHWNENFLPMQSTKPLFKPDFFIQKISVQKLKLLDKFTLSEILKAYGKSSIDDFSNKDYFEFAEQKAFNDHIKIAEPRAELKDINTVNVFFGTNRNLVDAADSTFNYGNEESSLKYGSCTISIPKTHIQGDLERPKLWIVFKQDEDPMEHIVLEKISKFEETDFLNYIRKEISNSPKKSAFIFIHGFNVTFEEAAMRTAQIAFDIPFNGKAGFFSWPSAGKKLDYLKDIEKADVTIPALEDFIENLLIESGIEKLHLIAHSMGNRILTRALNNLWVKPEFQNKKSIIDQIILGAADIDREVFKTTILPVFKDIGTRRTIYSSDQDKALILSKNLRRGRERLGDAGANIFVSGELDSIDASKVKSEGNKHSYIFETKELLSDMFYLIEKGFAPIDRRLRSIPKDHFNFWLFPE